MAQNSPSPDLSHEGRGNYSSDNLSFPLSQRERLKRGGGGKMKKEEETEWPSAKAVRMMGIKLRAER